MPEMLVRIAKRMLPVGLATSDPYLCSSVAGVRSEKTQGESRRQVLHQFRDGGASGTSRTAFRQI